MSHPVAARTPSTEDLDGLVEGLKQESRAGTARPDAAGAVLDHPSLARRRTLFVDLAYEEYCLQEEAGAAPDPEAFCRGLPAFRTQVREVIRGHCLMADNPGLFARDDVAWPKPGDEFERLRVVKELGRGAFARVYLATDPDAGNRHVVLKLAPTPSVEAGTLGPLSHPHIGTVLWARPVGKLFALCMPYVGSTTLTDVIATAFASQRPDAAGAIRAARGAAVAPSPIVTDRMPHARAVAAVGARLADALAHLHRAGIAHGDLKPSNVLIGAGGHPYLIDFNLAEGADATLLRCGGTLPYMAPERVRMMLGRGAKKADPIPADVYAFGALLFEFLTGRVPIEPKDSADLTAVAADLVARTPPPVRALVPDFPAVLARLIDQCLSIDPTRRPDAAELSRRLERIARPRVALPLSVGALLIAGGLVAAFGASPAAKPITTQPVVVEPRTPEELIARGLDLLAAGKVPQAERDFLAAQAGGANPKAAACQAYCQTQYGQHGAAISLLEQAIADKYDAGWVHNNLAYCLLTQQQFEAAERHAAAAIGKLDDPRPAHYVRARVWYATDLDRGEYRLRNPRARTDIEKALPGLPAAADQCVTKALILAATNPGPDNPDAAIIELLDRAVRLGHPPAMVAQHPVLAARLAGQPAFDQLKLAPPLAVEKPKPLSAYGLISPRD